jgi:hypothetical protein
MQKTERETKLEKALITLIEYAEETNYLWHNEKENGEIGKRLAAMAGRIQNYDECLTKIHDLVQQSVDYYLCETCFWKTGDPNRLKPLLAEDYEQLEPNCLMPAGVCPACADFVYLKNNQPRELKEVGSMANFIRHLYARVCGGLEELEEGTETDLIEIVGRIGYK